MNSRQRFLEVMSFNKDVRSVKWEFGFWGANVKQWYREGLPKKLGTPVPTRTQTISSSLYTAAWTHQWRQERTYFEKFYDERQREPELPDGIAVWGGALYYPSQGFPYASDIADYFHLDESTAQVPVEQLFYPAFEPRVLDEDEVFLNYVDLDGVTRRFHKTEAVIPTAMDWPIKDWTTWSQIKEERLRLDNIRARFPADWDDWVREYRDRTYPLAVGGYPLGFFGSPVHLMGYANVFYKYYDAPDLLHDFLDHLTTLWLAIWEEISAEVEIDCCHIWEDMSANKGSMISKATFREFLMPYYKRVTDFLKGRGVKVILVDTDGNCADLIPLFLESGITGLYPMEVSAGMDVVKARKDFPTLQMMGGVPKYDMALGKRRIDEFLEPVAALLESGGYIPHGDHCISPGVSWQQFKYYRETLNRIIDFKGSI